MSVRGNQRDVGPWVPGSRFASPGMTEFFLSDPAQRSMNSAAGCSSMPLTRWMKAAAS